MPGFPCLGRAPTGLATSDDARQCYEFSRFDFEFQFADDLLGMFRLKIPRLPEVPSKAVVISDVTQHGDSLSVRRPKYSSTCSMTSFLLSVVSTSVLIHSSCSGGSLASGMVQVIGYCPLGSQDIKVGEFLEGIRVRKHRYGHFCITDKQGCTGIAF